MNSYDKRIGKIYEDLEIMESSDNPQIARLAREHQIDFVQSLEDLLVQQERIIRYIRDKYET